LDTAGEWFNLTLIKRNTMKGIQLTLALLFILGICIPKTSISQDITGTWEGYYGTGEYYSRAVGMKYLWDKDSLFLHMELQQKGRKISGIFYYYSDSNHEKPDVIYQVSGLLDKKDPLSFFRLIMSGVVQDNSSRKRSNLLFHSLEATYRQADNSEQLYGNWYPEKGNGGVYWVRKTSPAVSSLVSNKQPDN